MANQQGRDLACCAEPADGMPWAARLSPSSMTDVRTAPALTVTPYGASSRGGEPTLASKSEAYSVKVRDVDSPIRQLRDEPDVAKCMQDLERRQFFHAASPQPKHNVALARHDDILQSLQSILSPWKILSDLGRTDLRGLPHPVLDRGPVQRTRGIRLGLLGCLVHGREEASR
jgi:hypothetical protein